MITKLVDAIGIAVGLAFLLIALSAFVPNPSE